MSYWAGVKGHSEYHPVKNLLKDCWEYEYKDLESFGLTVKKEADRLWLNKYENTPSVAIPVVPPWMFPMPLIEFQIQK